MECVKIPEKLEGRIINSIKFLRQNEDPLKLVIVGCQNKYIQRIMDCIVGECDCKSEKLDGKVARKQPLELMKSICNLEDNGLLYISNFEYLNVDLIDVLESAINKYSVEYIIGKGSSAKSVSIPVSHFGLILFVDDITHISKNFIQYVDDIIDLKDYDLDFRTNIIDEFLEKNNLIMDQFIKMDFSKRFINDDQLKINLIKIRNKAYESNIQEISEEFLNKSINDSITDIDKINDMKGREFELFTGNLFQSLGYENVKVTQSSGDFGADVIAEKDGVRFVIQCKRYKNPIGVSAVQEVIASKSIYDCHVACILTNSTFTSQAEELAKKNLVVMWDAVKLKEFIDRVKI